MASDQEVATAEETTDPFDKFLKAEYNNVAQAHFNTAQSISEFFKAYITVVSLPISAAVIFLKPAELKSSGLLAILKTHAVTVAFGFGFVALIGLLVLAYIVNLRCDAVLYARTVNGIRKYFYEGKFDLETENRFRVLPKRTQTPRYWEKSYFLFVVLAFGSVGTAYLFLGLYFYYTATGRPLDVRFRAALAFCPASHVAMYGLIARFRERGYQKSRILGVDIDGVLNKHREQFSRVLEERTRKQLAPDGIIRIPVHEIPDTDVSIEDERAVFNWPAYWTEMPEVENVGEIIKRIPNELGFDIWIFTHRPWPRPEWYRKERAEEYKAAWEEASCWSRYAMARSVRRLEKWLGDRRIPEMFGSRPIRSLTKSWLREKQIPYRKLIVERGNTDARDPLFATRNRFVISARKEIRAFVEDDLNKAKRLADACEVVFLLDQPYNHVLEGEILPKNVVRVGEWREIYIYLRRVF